MRKTLMAAVIVAVAGILVASGSAKNIVGTPRNDVLRGTGAADLLNGKGGNDTLMGLGGNDVLVGGAGNDKLVGGPGADSLNCGPGKDVAVADRLDKISPSCEKVLGIPKPTISIADAKVAEGNAGTTPLTFAVSLSAPSYKPVSVHFATADGTATAPGDYASASGTITFKAGQKSKSISVAVVGETAYEADESLTVSLSGPVNATIADGSATGTIANDDHPLAKAGHFHGPISSGGFVDFDVSSDGASLTNLVIVFNASCQPNASLTDSVRDSDSITVQPDGSFSINGSGTGITVKFSGKFGTSGDLAAGNLQIHESIDYEGTHYECDTGNATWGAAWQG